MNYRISHPTKMIECEINLPSSKSISNRLLIIQSLCREKFEIKNLSDSDDTISLQSALSNTTNTIDVGAAGTSFRFLASYLSTLEGKEFILTGTRRIQERPIKELVDALKNLGANISYAEKKGFPPLKIIGAKLLGGKITIEGRVSSQFISSLLLIAPTLKKGLTLNIIGEIVSLPYIEMTIKQMQEFGINSIWIEDEIKITPQKYIARDYSIESDWSAAAFWFEIAALSKKCSIKLNGLSKKSFQGDSKVSKIFSLLGVTSFFENNTLIIQKNNNINFPYSISLLKRPDLYQPLMCTLFSLDLDCKITGLKTLKDKETNRIYAVRNELEKLNSTKIIKTYKDHRMAMSFAPLSLKYGEITIKDTGVVSKSYPNYWEDLEKAGFIINSSTH